MRSKRKRSNENNNIFIKRHVHQVHVETREMRAQNDSLSRKSLNTVQIPPYMMSSKVILINIISNDDAISKLTRSDSISSLEMKNFQSIDDFSIEDSRVRTELPELIELINVFLFIEFRRNEHPSLNEKTIFSQYLHSSFSARFDTQIISHNVMKNNINWSAQCINSNNIVLLFENFFFNEPINYNRIKSKKDAKSSKSRIKLRLHSSKPSYKSKLKLKLSQFKKKNMKHCQQRQR